MKTWEKKKNAQNTHFFNCSSNNHCYDSLPHKEGIVTPDKSCTVDSDCALKSASCGPCSCKEPVNKNWTLECPRISKFEQKHMSEVRCMPCYEEGIHFAVKCVSGECQKVWNETIINY